MGFGLFAVAFAGSAVGLWLVSQITEALRPVPQTPKTLRWAPDIPIGYVDIGGCKLRYIKAGRGPNLVLLHALRTQLDLFEKVVPELARRFTVYALDYPGESGAPGVGRIASTMATIPRRTSGGRVGQASRIS